MTTISPVLLVPSTQLTSSDVSYYSAPTRTVVKISHVVFTNTSVSASTITAGITTGVSLTAPTTLIAARPIAAGEAYVSPELAGQVFPAGSQIHAYQGTTGNVTFTVSGLVVA